MIYWQVVFQKFKGHFLRVQSHSWDFNILLKIDLLFNTHVLNTTYEEFEGATLLISYCSDFKKVVY